MGMMTKIKKVKENIAILYYTILSYSIYLMSIKMSFLGGGEGGSLLLGWKYSSQDAEGREAVV